LKRFSSSPDIFPSSFSSLFVAETERGEPAGRGGASQPEEKLVAHNPLPAVAAFPCRLPMRLASGLAADVREIQAAARIHHRTVGNRPPPAARGARPR
jgi:hypothetical protein